MCTLCDSTNINTIIQFVPHVSGDGFNGGSDSYLQFQDTCGKRRNINLILYVTPQKEITWGCIWRTRWQVVKTPTIISNNPVLWGHRRICGPSLTETSLCDAYLYNLQARLMKLRPYWQMYGPSTQRLYTLMYVTQTCASKKQRNGTPVRAMTA